MILSRGQVGRNRGGSLPVRHRYRRRGVVKSVESVNLKVFSADGAGLRWNRDVGQWTVDANGDVWGMNRSAGLGPAFWVGTGGSSTTNTRTVLKPVPYGESQSRMITVSRYNRLTGVKEYSVSRERHKSAIDTSIVSVAFRRSREPGAAITTDGMVTGNSSTQRRFYMEYGIDPDDGLVHYFLRPNLGKGIVSAELFIGDDSALIGLADSSVTIRDVMMTGLGDYIDDVSVVMPTGEWATGGVEIIVDYTDMDSNYIDEVEVKTIQNPPTEIGWKVDILNNQVVSYGTGNRFIPGNGFDGGDREWGLTSGLWCQDGLLVGVKGYSSADVTRHSPIVYHLIKVDTSTSPWTKVWEYPVQEENTQWQNTTLGNWGIGELLVYGDYVRLLHDGFQSGSGASAANRYGIFMTQVPQDGSERLRFSGPNIFPSQTQTTAITSDTTDGVLTGEKTQAWVWNYKSVLDSLEGNGVGETKAYSSLKLNNVLYRDGEAALSPPLNGVTEANIHQSTAMFGGLAFGHSEDGIFFLGREDDDTYDGPPKILLKGPQPSFQGVDTGADAVPASTIFPPNNQYYFHSYFYEVGNNKRYSQIQWAFYVTLGNVIVVPPEDELFPHNANPPQGGAISEWFDENTTIEQVNQSLLDTFGTVSYTNGGLDSDYPVARMVSTYGINVETDQGCAFQRGVPLEFRFSNASTLMFNPGQKTPPVWNNDQLAQVGFKVNVITRSYKIPGQGEIGLCDWNGQVIWSHSDGNGTAQPEGTVYKNSMYVGFPVNTTQDIPIPQP